MKKSSLVWCLFVWPFFCLAQNVGIGTTTPHSKALLHVDLGNNPTKGILVTGTEADPGHAPETVPDLGAGSRMMFFPGTGVFRAGIVSGSQWDESNTGYASAAFGSSVTASQSYAFGAGFGTGALGYASVALGFRTTALNSYATALGYFTMATGNASTAFGSNTHANGSMSSSMGWRTVSNGYASTVVGMYNDSILLVNQTSAENTTPLFIIGNGNAINDRSNAMVVRKDGNVGIGTNTPAEKLTVLQNGTGNGGISITLSSASNNSKGVFVQHNGIGPGVYSSVPGGTAIWGITNSFGNAAVKGENNTGEAVVGISKGINGIGAVFGRNDSSGYGVRGINTKTGIGVIGQAGLNNSTGRAGVFENINAANSSNALEAKTNGTGAAAFFTNTGTGPAFITSQGNVGIGIASPAYAMDISGRIRLRGGGTNATSAGIWLNKPDNSSEIGFIGVYDNTYFGWYGTGGASWNLLMNTTNGNIGIGTQNPSQKLHVNGNICYTGSIAACSDIRYKKDIAPLNDALQQVMSMHAIYYHWDKEKFADKSFTDERQLGFSAQEIKKLFPEIVQTDAAGYMAVDYSRLTPVLVEAVQEQQSQIEKQNQEIKELKKALALVQQKLNEAR